MPHLDEPSAVWSDSLLLALCPKNVWTSCRSELQRCDTPGEIVGAAWPAGQCAEPGRAGPFEVAWGLHQVGAGAMPAAQVDWSANTRLVLFDVTCATI